MDYESFKEEVKKIDLGDFLKNYCGVKTVVKNNRTKYQCINSEHADKNPSSIIFDNRESGKGSCLYCEVCKTRYNIYQCISKINDLPLEKEGFVEVMKIISEYSGIEMPKINSGEESSSTIDLKKRKTHYASLFKKNLESEDGFYARDFLRERGFTDQTIVDFNLGLTPKKAFKYHLSGVSDKVAIPILDVAGTGVIAISFRRLNECNDEPKYKNECNDEVFNKSETLFGYSYAIEHIRKNNHIYLVEGYFDMISMYQIGLKNCVAFLGATITNEQIMKIKRICNNVTILADADEAGVNGAKTSALNLIKNNVNVKIFYTTTGNCKDMNDLCNYFKWNKDKVSSIINSKSSDAILFLLNEMYSAYDNKIFALQCNLLKKTNKVLECVEDQTKREIYKQMFNKRI